MWSPTQSGVPKAPSAGWWLSLLHLLSDFSDFQLTDFLSPPSYIIVQSPTQSLEWHVWSSSSGNNCYAVHRSLSSSASVYECIMWFYLVPYCQQSPPTRFLLITAIGMCHFLPVHHFGRVEGQYTTLPFCRDVFGGWWGYSTILKCINLSIDAYTANAYSLNKNKEF